MTRLMEQAIDALHVADDRQDEIAGAVMQCTGLHLPFYMLKPKERADILQSKTEIERGEFATAVEARAIWAEHGL